MRCLIVQGSHLPELTQAVSLESRAGVSDERGRYQTNSTALLCTLEGSRSNTLPTAAYVHVRGKVRLSWRPMVAYIRLTCTEIRGIVSAFQYRTAFIVQH